jgi:hypothetical protein
MGNIHMEDDPFNAGSLLCSALREVKHVSMHHPAMPQRKKLESKVFNLFFMIVVLPDIKKI